VLVSQRPRFLALAGQQQGLGQVRAPRGQVRVPCADRLPPAADRADLVDPLLDLAARDLGNPGG
jgi:hypothetical protein